MSTIAPTEYHIVVKKFGDLCYAEAPHLNNKDIIGVGATKEEAKADLLAQIPIYIRLCESKGIQYGLPLHLRPEEQMSAEDLDSNADEFWGDHFDDE